MNSWKALSVLAFVALSGELNHAKLPLVVEILNDYAFGQLVLVFGNTPIYLWLVNRPPVMRRFPINQKSIVMKKVKTVLAAALLLFSAFAFASDGDKVTEKVKVAFLNDFSAASNVSWEITNDYYFATFTINQMEVNAAYNEIGELIGTSRTIGSSQLPLSISLALAKKYEGYTIPNKAIELAFEGSTRYYLTLVNNHQILKLKCSANGDIQVERKIKRK